MKKCSLPISFLSLLAFLLAAVPAYPYTYTGYDKWGDGTWHDAEKLPGNTEDDLMCWAAAAANILDWGGMDRGIP